MLRGPDPEDLKVECTMEADLSALCTPFNMQKGLSGESYWRIDYGIEVQLGLTELRAKIKWYQNVSEDHTCELFSIV